MHGKPALADVDGDGVLDVVVAMYNTDDNKYELHAFDVYDHDNDNYGEEIPGVFDEVNAALVNFNLFSSPTFGHANVDADPQIELVLVLTAVEGYVRTWKMESLAMAIEFKPPEGFPIPLAPSPLFTNLDDDGDYELLVAIGGGGGAGEIWIHKWDPQNNWWGFQEKVETIPNAGIGCAPIVCDIDLNGKLDLIVGTYEGKVYCWGKGSGKGNLSGSKGGSKNIPTPIPAGVIPSSSQAVIPQGQFQPTALPIANRIGPKVLPIPNREAVSSGIIHYEISETGGGLHPEPIPSRIIDPKVTYPDEGSYGLLGAGLQFTLNELLR